VGYNPTLNVAYGGLDGEHYWYARTEVWKHPLLSRYVPKAVLEPRAIRRLTAPEEDFNVLRGAHRHRAVACRRERDDRCPRPARRPGRALGDVDAGAGRHEAHRGHARPR
jgi:hypothetical protein